MSATYKGLKFASHVAPFLPFMESMNDHREGLRGLQGSWETLALLGHLSNLRADMSETRESFDGLTERLLGALAEESFSCVTSGLGYKAQFSIDILVRNLFERTADIGFLATDTSVVAGCLNGAAPHELRQRFSDYVKRYSVYRDVILLDTSSEVLCQLQETPAGASSATMATLALNSTGYVERYDISALTGAAPALTYSSAVRSNGAAVGALVLVFDLASEATVVFDKLREGEELVAFLDAGGRVVVSSDAQTLPVGYKLPKVGAAALVRLGGCNYVAVQRQAAPYQGYAGPGWTAVAMVPADTAFRHVAHDNELRFSGETVFSPELVAIPEEAANIQRRLERVVWNGRLQQADDGTSNFSRALLAEIANTGRRTKTVFETSTAELLDTAAASLLNETHMLSALAVDILDRNLFERACDCRWWAQDAALQSLDPAAASKVLRYINGLYTVYTDIVVFDLEGRVMASSQGALESGAVLEESWVRECLMVTNPLGYVVSSFASTPLYDTRATYIYAAPLKSGGRTVGGVGLVFDSEPQFAAMLQASLPQRPGTVAAFLRTDGTVISATGELPVAPSKDMLALDAGGSWSGLVANDGRCYAAAATAGAGYREFKTSDGYDELIIALVIVPCGTVKVDAGGARSQLRAVTGGQEIATFDIGEQSVGVPSRSIVECIEVGSAVRVPAALGVTARGYTPWRDGMLPLVDIGHEMGEAPITGRQAVVMEAADGKHFGLLVSELGPIVDLEVSDLPVVTRGPAGRELMTHVARSDNGMVPLLSPANVAELLVAA
jgi:chemotaxis signal transduction protein